MSQVTLLSVDVSQPIENSSKSDSSLAGGDADRFANLVEQHMDHRGKSKNTEQKEGGKQLPHEPNQATSDSAKDLTSETSQNDSASLETASTPTKTSKEEEVVARDHQDESSNSEIDESSAEYDESQIGMKNTDGLENQAQKDNQLAAEQAKAKSQALLNLLAASDDLLIKVEKNNSAKDIELTVDNTDLDITDDTVKRLFDKSKLSKPLEVASEKLASQFSEDAKISENEIEDTDSTRLVKGDLNKLASTESIINSTKSKDAQASIGQEIMAATNKISELEQDAEEHSLKSETDVDTDNKVLKELLAALNEQNNGKKVVQSQNENKKAILTSNDSEHSQKQSSELKQEHAPLDPDSKVSVNDSIPLSQVIKTDLESNKPSSMAGSINDEKKLATQVNVNLGQSEQGNKEQHSKDAQKLNKDIELEQHAEEQLVADISAKKSVKQAETTEKNMVAETLAKTQMNSVFNATKAEVEHISESANEQLVEHLTSRVVKENVQVQKAQLAMETISIYRKDFANEVKEKVMVMINQKLQQVDIQLDPPELGNMHVRVNLQNEQASVSFMVQNLQAKEALEQHMGKLKDMLADSGVDVGNSNVEQQSQSSQNEQNEKQSGQSGSEGMAADNDDVTEIPVNMVKASALGVDFYA